MILHMRYAIVREYAGDSYFFGARDVVGQAPTIDEAHVWIMKRIKRAREVGLRLRPLDFDVVDTWDEP